MNKLKIHLLKRDDEFKNIFLSARNCFHNEDIITLMKSYNEESAIKLTKTLLSKKHMTIFEHCTYQFVLENVSRSFLAQFSRHRTGLSITVKSQHYINHKNYKHKNLETDNLDAQILYGKAMNYLNEIYNKLTDDYNIPHYIAREVLPNSTLCNIFCTVNLRELIHILNLRIGKENTPEIRTVSKEIFNLLKSKNHQLWNLIDNEYNITARMERDKTEEINI